jgi:hypothetical protein
MSDYRLTVSFCPLSELNPSPDLPEVLTFTGTLESQDSSFNLERWADLFPPQQLQEYLHGGLLAYIEKERSQSLPHNC